MDAETKPFSSLDELDRDLSRSVNPLTARSSSVLDDFFVRLLLTARAGMADSERLDWLDKEAHVEPLLLHDGRDDVRGNYRGLGLMPGNVRRDLREAIDAARATSQGGADAATQSQKLHRSPEESR